MQEWVVVITGASRGIGLATARASVALGARVVLVGRDDAALLDAAAQLGERATIELVDLAIPGAATALVERVLARHGRIDLLINNAARTAPATAAWELSGAEVAATLAVNVAAAFEATRALIAWAVPRGATARVVNVSSAVVAEVPAHAVDYVTSKAALDGMTRALARDLYGSGVTLVGVRLGPHRTTMAAERWSPEAHAALPDATQAATAIVRAATQPAAIVHGRILAADEGRLTPARARRGAIDRARPRTYAMPLGPSPHVRAALAAITDDELARLPGEDDALTAALAAHHDLPPACFAIGSGISELLERVLALFVRPGETVLANAPSWPLFPQLCDELGLGWQRVPYRLDGQSVQHDLASFSARVHGLTRLAYVVSPGNPSARAVPAEAIEALLRALPPSVLVVVDEAYGEFTTHSAKGLIGRHPDRLIVLRTFSKFFGLGGLRIGYAIAAAPLAATLARAAPPFAVNRAAQLAALAALRDTEHQRATRAFHRDERARIEQRLDAAGIAHLDSDAPFLLVAQPGATLLGGFLTFSIGSIADNDRRLAAITEAHGIRS